LRKITRFRSSGDPVAAAAVIAADSADSALTVVFASAHDLAALGRELAVRGIRHVIGAATGRIIGADGFEATGVSGFHLPAGRFAAANVVLEEVAGMGLPEVRAHVRELRLELARAALKHFSETYEPVLDQSRGFANLQRLRSVNNIIGRQSIVQPARGARIANRFTDGHRERDDVVFHLGFQLRDASHHAGVDARIFLDLLRGFGRYHATLGKRLRRGDLHLEPALELALLTPDTAHFFARIS